jgi:hypothetical protein
MISEYFKIDKFFMNFSLATLELGNPSVEHG